MQAASTLLRLMAFKGVDRKCLAEDVVEDIVLAVMWQVTRHVNPALDPSTFKMKECSTSAAASNPGFGSSSATSLSVTPPALVAPLLNALPSTLSLLESLVLFVNSVPLGDSQLLTISHTLMETLTLSPVNANAQVTSLLSSLHLTAISTLRAIFQQYPRHRTVMLEDLFPVMLRLPTARKQLRTYPVDTYSLVAGEDDDDKDQQMFEEEEDIKTQNVDAKASHIQMVTALVLFMVQGAATNPKLAAGGLNPCAVVIDFFVSQLLSRTNKKSLER